MSSWPELRETRTIRAKSATGAVIRCSLTDMMLSDLSVSVVFFYDQTPDIDRLADGLARAFEQVPLFAGRLRTAGDRLELVCDGSGISMPVYDVDESLDEAIARATLPGSGYVDHVDAPKVVTDGLPLLSIRVNRLNDGGMVLGCSWQHSAGDMQSFMLLMHSWSAVVEGRQLPETVLLDDPDSHFDSVLPAGDSGRPGFRLLDEAETALVQAEFGRAMRTNRTLQIYFSDAELARMKEQLSAAAGRWLSTNDALCGLVLSTVRTLDEDPEAREMAMPVNIRTLLELPPDAVGNLVNEVFIKIRGASSPESTAVQIRQALENFAGDHLNLRANAVYLDDVEPSQVSNYIPIGFDPSRKTFTVTNWSRFGIYDVAFDGHPPVFFCPAANLQLPWIGWLAEGFDGTGTVLTITVPGGLVAKLRSAEGRAALHRYRDQDEQLPARVAAARKVV